MLPVEPRGRQEPPRSADQRRSGGSGSRSVWLVVIAVAGIVLAGLLGYAFLGADGDAPEVTPSPSETASVPPESTSAPTEEAPPTGEEYWGSMPPRNGGELRDLQDPSFPESVGGFVQAGEIRTDFDGGNTNYDSPDYRTFNADVNHGHSTYDMHVGDMLEPAYLGDAVCGVDAADPTLGTCVMAGQAEVLTTRAVVEDVPLEELAALTLELYGKL